MTRVYAPPEPDVTPRKASAFQRAYGEAVGLSGRAGPLEREAQETRGNRPKLTLNTPGDRYEQEADRIADQAVTGAMDANPSTPDTAAGLRRQVVNDKGDNAEEIRAKPSGAAPSNAGGVTQASAAISSGGRPLPRYERSYFEPRLGQDFSKIRIHDDTRTGTAARGINARAYTLGNHIGFANGEYRPDTLSGKRLIAHELVHTVQRTAPGLVQCAPPTGEAEASESDPALSSIQKKVLADGYGQPSELLADIAPLSETSKRDLVEIFTVDYPDAKVGRRNVGELIWETMYDRKVDHEPIGDEAQKRAGGTGRWVDEASEEGGLKPSHKMKRVYKRWDKKAASGRLSRLQCMNAGNQGMSALIEPEVIGPAKAANARSEDGANVTRLAHLLRRHGAVGERLVFSYQAKAGRWNPDFEDTLLAETSKDPEPGVYFFLVSLHAHHMVMIMVDRNDVAAPKFYFLDQFGGFLTFNKDGTVKGAKRLSAERGITKEAKTFKGIHNPTIMWPVMPKLPEPSSGP
ncbi:DUF4157 domain-containing protein [uncultured Tateyamaria sp.]|uniref:eCIS core domain-containing protein n=1 Tax=uncultured Tateyamaria sp. TaxID=455651 RepID=UPI0026135182|nr:DUF4157 domain-containing protein [uncultured Tateyamaria sp.]